jgi:hypothetical protein
VCEHIDAGSQQFLGVLQVEVMDKQAQTAFVRFFNDRAVNIRRDLLRGPQIVVDANLYGCVRGIYG